MLLISTTHCVSLAFDVNAICNKYRLRNSYVCVYGDIFSFIYIYSITMDRLYFNKLTKLKHPFGSIFVSFV